MSEKKGRENLIPQNKRTKEEQRSIARAGGRASGEARRKKKMLRELMETALEMREQKDGIKRMMMDNGWAIEDIDQKAVITQGLIMKAKQGDVFAYNAIRDIMGEKPVDETKLSGVLDTKIEIGFVETSVGPKGSEEEVDI